MHFLLIRRGLRGALQDTRSHHGRADRKTGEMAAPLSPAFHRLCLPADVD
jgi:hypothetical protein